MLSALQATGILVAVQLNSLGPNRAELNHRPNDPQEITDLPGYPFLPSSDPHLQSHKVVSSELAPKKILAGRIEANTRS